jgi:hypothetical protein
VIAVAESEGNRSNQANPGASTGREGERLGKAASTSKGSASLEGGRARRSELAATGTASTEAKQSDRKVEGLTGTVQKNLTDRLKRASESEKKAYLNNQLEQLERSKRELNLPAERRALIQSDNMEHNTERAREQLARTRLRANEIAEVKSAEHRAEQRKAKLEKAYTEFKEGVVNGKLEKRDAKKIKVDGKDLIIPKDTTHNPDSPEFWSRHRNTKEVYDTFARQYPEIQKQLAGGKTIEEIRKDPELNGAASFWYSHHEVIASEYKSYMFVEKGYHRAELAREYDLTGIPVRVYDWFEKEN